MIKAVIFDCFGVLIEDGLSVIGNRFKPSQQQWQQMRSYGRQADLGKLSSHEVQAKIADVLGVAPAEIEQIMNGLHKNTQLLGLIEQLRQTGLKIGFISNVSNGFIDSFFSRAEKDLFDDMLISGKLGIIKPDPRIYQASAKNLGLSPSECLFIDDIQRNVDGAKAVGMQTFVYEDVNHFKNWLSNLGYRLDS